MQKLLEASKRGEREAFGTLVERYQGVVCAVSYSRTGDRTLSEDVAQDTFLAAWRQLDQLREAGRLRAWLCGIARNLARKARLRTARETPLEALSPPFEGANPFDQAAEAESERVVRDALVRVPETYRDVLVLYYREHRSVRDVARLLGITEAATLQRLARGRQYLADGVTDLVERSLRGHVQKSLVVGVLAALALAPSRADASTHGTRRPTMIKLAFVAAAAIAVGTTAVVTHRSSNETTTPVAAAAIAAPKPVAKTPTRATIPEIVHVATTPPLPPGGVRVPEPDELPTLDHAALAHAHAEQGPARGPADAPVTIVVFTDMMCPHCGNALGTIDQLWEEYPGKLRLVFKNLPVHKAAVLAAEANFAADAQGKFWELHDLMIAHQDDLSRDVLLGLATQAGLDVPTFRTALDTHQYAAALDADRATAAELEINATPTFVINGRRVIGNRPVEAMRAQIDEALANL